MFQNIIYVMCVMFMVRERSHMTSVAEGGGGFEMLTVADKGGGGV